MTRISAIILLIAATVIFYGCGSGDTDTTATDDESAAATATSAPGSTGTSTAVTPSPDITGQWNATLTHVSVTGDCPATPTQTGVADIAGSAGAYTLTLSGGFDCRPVAACSFTCTGSGDSLSCTNGGVADDEGGTYTSNAEIRFTSDKAASGTDNSTYSHPGGFDCSWVANLSLTR